MPIVSKPILSKPIVSKPVRSDAPAMRRPAAARIEPRLDPRLDRALRHVIACGLLAVLLLPAARGTDPWLGWLPLWLLAMPLSAWWALHRFPLPHWPRAATARRRRGQPQARRRVPPPRRARQLQAA